MELAAVHTLVSMLYALLGGILPALIWLIFWYQEDKKNPEPKGMILIIFFAGMAAVFVSIVLEKIAFDANPQVLFFSGFLKSVLAQLTTIARARGIALNTFLLTTIYAPIIEETLKFLIVFVLVLHTVDAGEPIDPMVYMITSAVGFSAMENVLFLINPLLQNNIGASLLTGDIRFIGATLLHTVCSATVGIFISFHFFRKPIVEYGWAAIGLILAICIHSAFNFFMTNTTNYFFVLEVLWITVIIVLLAFEKIKRVRLQKI